MRKLTILIGCLVASACSNNSESDLSGPMNDGSAPPFDVEVTNTAAPETADERKARLRKKAETDPDAADAEAIDNMGRNEVIATAINSAGYLCARVTSAYPVGGNINVECVEYRSGKGRANYRIDPNAGTVEPR